jgi:hypothetical protein
VLEVVGLVVGLAFAALLWDIWIYQTLKLREGPGVTSPVALLPPAVILIEIIAVITTLAQLFRHRQQGLTRVNLVVWSSNVISFLMLQIFGAK